MYNMNQLLWHCFHWGWAIQAIFETSYCEKLTKEPLGIKEEWGLQLTYGFYNADLAVEILNPWEYGFNKEYILIILVSRLTRSV